jgi:hypothetical protein
MAQRLAAPAPHHYAGLSLWTSAISTVVLAIGAIMIVLWKPEALALALLVGGLAVASRTIFVKVRDSGHEPAEASSAVANAGLGLAAIAIVPLIAFAVLWAGLIVYLGISWVFTRLGF